MTRERSSDTKNIDTDNRIIYLHCGYPKTATTTMQQWVFPKISAWNYIGRILPEDDRKDSEWILEKGFRLGLNGNSAETERYNEAVKELERIRATTRGACFFSLENITARCFVPQVSESGKELISGPPSLQESLTHAKSLCETAGFDDVRPIVTLRPQSELLASFYAQAYMAHYGRSSGLRSFSEFIDLWLSSNKVLRSDTVDFCVLDDTLKRMFGNGKYKFLLFDWLKSDPSVFSSELARFTNARSAELEQEIKGAQSENRRRVGDERKWKMHRLNSAYLVTRARALFLPNRSLGIGRFLEPALSKLQFGPKELEMSKNDLVRIQEFYAESNAEFGRRYPDLKQLSLV